MDLISKGSKPIAYKSKMNIKFFSTAIKDSRATVNHIFVKLTDEGEAVVYGELAVFLLFCYTSAKNQLEYLTKTQMIKFNETVHCPFPEKTKAESLRAEVSFTPRALCTEDTAGSWNVTVEGEIDVYVYGERHALRTQTNVPKTGQNFSETATVICIENKKITTNELLEMDTETIRNLAPAEETENNEKSEP